MSGEQNPGADARNRGSVPLPPRLLGLLVILLAAGALAFAYGLARSDSLRAWQIFLVNFLFWSGMAQAGVVFAAILHLTGARWAGPIKRLAAGAASFLPVSFVLFLVLIFGREQLFPWISHPVPEKAAWLNAPFLFARDAVGLLALYSLSLAFLYYSIRPALGAMRERAGGSPTAFHRAMMAGWRGAEKEEERSQRVLSALSPILVILYAFVFTLLAFDLVMSLHPHWYSTLFGGYFFIGNLYLGLATIAIGAVLARKYLGLEALITPSQLHDLGKLLFAFCMLWTYLFWSQYLVIWYGDLPEETGFVLTRVQEAPWAPLAWGVLVACFLVPFVVLLSRTVKRRPGSLAAISVVVVGGMWLERYVLVVPSLWKKSGVPLGGLEVLVTLGFFAAAALSYLAFVRVVPLLPAAPSEFHPEG
ncbi:MAG: molybdopterin oxidoreductase [Terriglobia bacterium]